MTKRQGKSGTIDVKALLAEDNPDRDGCDPVIQAGFGVRESDILFGRLDTRVLVSLSLSGER